MKRSTLLALIFASAVGGWILLFERGEPTNGDPERVFTAETDAIDEVVLARPGLPEVRLSRGGDGFLVRGGDGDPVPADPVEADQLLQNVAALTPGRALEADAPGHYGLDPPALRITVTTGDETRSAAFGNETLTGGNRYLRFGDAVFATPARSFRNFDRSAWDLRDLRVFRGNPTARGLRLEAGGVEAALIRAGGDWTITVPFRFAADSFAASQLARTLLDLRMTGVAGDGEEFGEPRLRARIDLDRDGESETRTVVFGADRPPGVLARVEGDPLVFVVSADPVEELQQALDAELAPLHSLRVFDISAWQVREARFEGEGRETAFLREEGEDATEWTLAGGGEALDSGAVEDLLYRLETTEAEAVGDAPGGDEPDWIVRIREEDAGEPAIVRIHLGPEQIRALRDGDERVLLLSRETWDGIRERLDETARPSLGEEEP